jgi:hypothetical protein
MKSKMMNHYYNNTWRPDFFNNLSQDRKLALLKCKPTCSTVNPQARDGVHSDDFIMLSGLAKCRLFLPSILAVVLGA